MKPLLLTSLIFLAACSKSTDQALPAITAAQPDFAAPVEPSQPIEPAPAVDNTPEYLKQWLGTYKSSSTPANQISIGADEKITFAGYVFVYRTSGYMNGTILTTGTSYITSIQEISGMIDPTYDKLYKITIDRVDCATKTNTTDPDFSKRYTQITGCAIKTIVSGNVDTYLYAYVDIDTGSVWFDQIGLSQQGASVLYRKEQ